MNTIIAKNLVVFVSLLTLLACKHNDKSDVHQVPIENSTNTPEIQNLNLQLRQIFSSLEFKAPVGLYPAKNGDWFLIEQRGVVRWIGADGNTSKIFLDISDKVQSGGEEGLLGMALDPAFETTGRFFLSYTNHDDFSIISEFQSQNLVADTSSENIILRVEQPYSNHNGGQISFGPDGYLYIGLGDGGSGGDPKENGQNINTLLGAMLRIDVLGDQSPYGIPSDNPFVNKNGADEIYAYGLRNPWRWSFDIKTGELWLADVGQNKWEEINIISKGGNYAWNEKEGKHCYQLDTCIAPDYIDPVFEYSHEQGQAVTGGYIYRGSSIPALEGVYLYGDYVSGRIWALEKRNDGNFENHLMFDSGFYISSFAQDNTGEVYVIEYQSGKIYKISQ